MKPEEEEEEEVGGGASVERQNKNQRVRCWSLQAPLEAGVGKAAEGCRAPSRTRQEGGTQPPPAPPGPRLLPLPTERSEGRGEQCYGGCVEAIKRQKNKNQINSYIQHKNLENK